MWKGIAVWYADVNARNLCRRGVALLTLTFAGEPDSDAYRNRVRQFWDAYRKAFGNRAYFAWAELQARGVVHYHAMVVDAPHPEQGHSAARLRHMWGVGRVNVLWRSAGWFREEATGYAASYAKKLGNKAYQQEYASIPPTLRTFMCSRVKSPAARAERTPGWAKLLARERGYAITDARHRPGVRGWLLRLSDMDTGEIHTERWTVRSTLIRGPTGRPVAALLGPVWVAHDSRRRYIHWGRSLRLPPSGVGPIRLPAPA